MLPCHLRSRSSSANNWAWESRRFPVRLYNATAMLTSLRSWHLLVARWKRWRRRFVTYNAQKWARPFSHFSAERIIIPDACTLLHYMLHLFNQVMDGLQVDEERMRTNLNMTGGLIFSQRILLALIDKGVGRQEAYKMVQRNAKKVWSMSSRGAVEGQALIEFLNNDEEVMQYLSPNELAELTDTDYYVRYIDTAFARLGL